ncbi:MAG TPA: (2Fe-2S)-binding protein [Nocardioidaceae bacterium]|nr:(2Fe-2S)-binding protein [Nocardioidaceae bacterium]
MVIVCHCEVVSCGEVARAVDNGARTVSQICGATGAGKSCGSCVFTLKRLLCEHRPSVDAVLGEAEGAAS